MKFLAILSLILCGCAVRRPVRVDVTPVELKRWRVEHKNIQSDDTECSQPPDKYCQRISVPI
jgi:hypothetical protein